MKTIQLLLAGVALSILAGCGTSKASTIPGMDVTTRLSRHDYVVLGTAEGKACAQESCFLGNCTATADVAGEELLDGRAESDSLRNVRTAVLDLGPLNFLLGTGNVGPSGGAIAQKIATYKAIESIPDADAMLSPRFESEITVSAIPFINKTVKSCVTVKGKAVRIKTDAEAAAGK